MKKKLSIILSSAFAFVLAFTLLGFSVRAAGKTDNSAQYIKAGEQVVQILAEDAEKKDGSLQSYLGMEKKKADDATISWGEMSGKFGTLTGFNEEKCSATVDDSTGSGTINIAVTGSNNRTGVVTIELAEGYIDSISCAIDDTFAESLEKAGMNTVIGLAMAFGRSSSFPGRWRTRRQARPKRRAPKQRHLQRQYLPWKKRRRRPTTASSSL